MLRRLSAAFVCIFLFAGCSQTSFIGRQVQNFTAYYNTFYNARQSFDEGIRNIERAPQTIDDSRFLPVYPPAPENVAGAQFDDAIKRSADVIRNHPTSRWVDNAVLLIGKSYFYQRNYPAAIQKFREAIDLGTDLEGEARFWLARTLVANGALTEARDHITYSLDSEDLPNRWRGPLLLGYADLLVIEEDWEEAASVLQEGLEHIRDREAEPRAFFLLGQVNEMLAAPDEATRAYRAVARYQPHYELEFKARLHELRTAALAGGVDGALVELRRMERDDKHRDRRAEIVYTRGVVEAGADRHDRAFDAFDILLYDTDYDISPVRGRAHYALGMLYRDVYEDFVLAGAHFDSAATTMPARAAAMSRENLTRMAITDSRDQAGIYLRYAQAFGQVTEMDSLLYLGAMSDEDFDEFVREQRERLAEELEARRREEERMRAQARFADGIAAQQGSTPEAQSPTDAAEVGASGFLFHRDPTRIQDGRQAFIRRWGNRPPVPGWRRQEAVDSYIVSRQEGGAEDQGGLAAIDEFDLGLPIFDVSAVPRTPAAYQRMVDSRALARYELGNVLFLSMDRPRDAARLYRQVIDENADLPVAARAYYALAEVHRSLDDEDEARRLYGVVLDRYPGSDLDQRIRDELGLPQPAATDSAAVTRQLMNDAAVARRDGRLEDAFAGYLDVGLTFPDYHTAAPALYSAAQTGLAWIRRDGLDLDAPLPAGRADSLVASAGLQWTPPEPQPVDTLDADQSPSLDDDTVDFENDEDVEGRAPDDMDGVDDGNTTVDDRHEVTSARDDRDDEVESEDISHEGDEGDEVDVGDEGDENAAPEDLQPDESADTAADAAGAESRADDVSGGGDGDGDRDEGGHIAHVAPDTTGADTTAASSGSTPQPIISVGFTPAGQVDDVALPGLALSDVLLADTTIGITVDAILRHLIERYPTSSVASGAELLQSGIEERLAAAAAPQQSSTTPTDSLDLDLDHLTVPLDSLTTGDPGVSDSLDIPSTSYGMNGEEEIDPLAGGWTIVAGTFDGPEGAEELLAGLRERDLRASLIESTGENGAPLYNVYVGQVEQRNQAALALRAHQGAFPSGARIIEMNGATPPSEDR